MGRSRGGLTTKIHALVDAEGLSISLKLTEGQAHDGRSGDDMLEQMQPGQILLADRAYDSEQLRQTLAERFSNKLKHFRGVATRFEKRADNYLAGVKLASARIWLRFNESMA
jgi:transposase